jgi:hypothetical protein
LNKKNKISRVFGILMLCLVMLTNVFGKQLQAINHESNKPKQEQKDSKQSEHHTTVSSLSLEVVVPSHAFDFSTDAIIIPAPQIIYVIVEHRLPYLANSSIPNTFLETLLENFVAPNSPPAPRGGVF